MTSFEAVSLPGLATENTIIMLCVGVAFSVYRANEGHRIPEPPSNIAGPSW